MLSRKFSFPRNLLAPGSILSALAASPKNLGLRYGQGMDTEIK